MSEIQKQTGTELAQKQQNQPLSPEQQKRFEKEKQEILMLSQAQRNSLSNEVVSSYLKNHHDIDISKYSPEIQKKFVEEVQMLFTEFKDFDTSMITSLRSIREGMSFGMEKDKKDDYYRNMIIGNAIESRITVLKATIETQYGETIEVKGNKVNKSDYQKLETNIKKLDSENGLKVFENILSKLRPGIHGGLNFSTLVLPDIIQQECKKNNKPYSQELFQTYNTTYQEFVGKNMVFNAKDGNGVISYKGKGFGLTSGGVNGLTNDRLKNIYKEKFEELNLENMGMADLVIMMRVLFSVIPVYGDSVGGYDDGKQALAGVNFDGSMHGLGENAFMFLISGLQLSIVGGTFAKFAKGPKLAKAMMIIGKIIDKLSKSPEMLKDLAKNEKVMKMLEAMKGVVPKVWELLEKIKNPKQTLQDIFPNTTKAVQGNDKKRIPKRRPEEILDQTRIPQKNSHVGWGSLDDYVKSSFDNYPDLLKLPEKFNPKTGLEYVRKLTGDERINAMKLWKKGLREQLDIIASIPIEVKKLSEGLDFSKLSKDEIIQSIVNQLYPMFEKLSVEQRKEVFTGIEKFIDRKIIIHKYAENPLYKNNPKKLVGDSLGVDEGKIKGEVTMEIDGANFTFYVHNEDDYKLLRVYGDEEKAKNSLNSGGFASLWSEIPELRGTISVANGANDGSIGRKGTKIHETRHMNNQIIMPDHSLRVSDKLSHAKDEIIAFFADGKRDIETIKDILLEKGNDALYDYYDGMKKNHPEMYKDIRKLYEQELLAAIDIAQRVQQANIPNYLDILAITPVRQWNHLEKIYLSSDVSQSEKIFKTIQMIFEKTGETYFALRNDMVNIMGDTMGDFTFYTSQALGVELIVFSYLEEYYPEWRTDLKNNINTFLGKMKILLHPNELQKYFENFGI